MIDDRARAFLEDNHAGIVVTARMDGSPHMARVAIRLFNGRPVCSGTQSSVRVKHLRLNNKAAFVVVDEQNTGNWIGMEGTVTIHEGPEGVEQLLALRRATGREPDDLDAFRRENAERQRLLLELQVTRVYGRY